MGGGGGGGGVGEGGRGGGGGGGVFFCKRKTAYEVEYGLVGSERWIRDRSCRE